MSDPNGYHNYEAELPPESRRRRAWYAFSVTGFSLASMAAMTLLTLIYGWKTTITENYNDNVTYIVGIVAVMYVGGSIMDNSGFLGKIGGWFGSRNKGSTSSTVSSTVSVVKKENETGGVG